MISMSRIGVVVIGRNEGERLTNCLKSITEQAEQVVYVDSGSTDNSLQVAQQFGAQIVELDMSIPFTAARARNEGFALLKNCYPHIEYVQFVDGDCEVVTTWLVRAAEFLDAQIDVAAVCGRRRERFPDKTIYNQLCDLEWDTPVGEAKACGGDVLMRVVAFDKAQGYRPDLIAGEEPELCVRFRAAGWKIWRINEEMTLHDAAMTRFGQWWKRTTRAGHAFAEGAYLHGAPPERHWVAESRRALLWGGVIPFIAILLSFYSVKWGALLLLIYPIQIARLALSGRNGWIASFYLVLGKFPEMIGQFKFYKRLLSGQQGQLIEYK